MPASVESYYNFGNFGFIVFSIFMGFLIYLISLFLNSKKKYLSNEHKIIYLIIFFPFLNLENHLIFMLKNSLYIYLILFSFIICLNFIFSKLNKSFLYLIYLCTYLYQNI